MLPYTNIKGNTFPLSSHPHHYNGTSSLYVAETSTDTFIIQNYYRFLCY